MNSKKTDKTIKELEKEIEETYKEAGAKAKEKLEKHLKSFEATDRKKRAQLKAGEITEEDYKSWFNKKVIVGKKWKTAVDNYARVMAEAERIATDISSGKLPEVFADEANYGAYLVEKNGIDMSFDLYNVDAVTRLVKDNPDLLPNPKTDIPKSQRWNKQKITNAVTQGILLGESIPDIAKRLEDATNMSKKAATRNARTMVTSAQNAGRLESFRRAEKLGIPIMKQWLATADGRTRKSHTMVDGKSVRVDEKFPGVDLMFPGDTDGAPEEVYNCRCTLICEIDVESLDDVFESRANLDVSYSHWEDSKND